jgi:hypothetical protein
MRKQLHGALFGQFSVFFWASLCPGGRISYLCHLDVERFHEVACDRARSINCIAKAEAREIAYDFREKRREFGIGYLMALDCDGVTGRLNAIYTTQFPDDHIIGSICERADLTICPPQTLELARRQSCKHDHVQTFLMRYEELFQRDRRLIWNADETQLNAMKRFKVICDQGHLPLVTAFEHVPHLTGMASIYSGGVVLAPIVILKNLQHLRELANRDTHCFFATSTNRWMTKDLWVYYSPILCAQISHYRLLLTLAVRDEDILLIIDGHKSRLSLLAALIFEMNGIDVLVLPPHSSHLLQMFDVGPVSPIKTAFKEELDKRMSGISTARPGEKMQRTRIALIESFINALHRGATPGNIISGFSRTGICPFNPDVVLRSNSAVEAPNASIFHTVNTGCDDHRRSGYHQITILTSSKRRV